MAFREPQPVQGPIENGLGLSMFCVALRLALSFAKGLSKGDTANG